MPRTRPLLAFLAILSLLIAPHSLATAQPDTPDGDWLGHLDTPGGTLRLLLTITDGTTDQPLAVLESLDQAPGQEIPVTRISASGGELVFEIAAIGARYSGQWIETTQRYEGDFQQGMSLPLNFERPAETSHPVIEGLDGRWEAALDREGTILNLVLNIETSEQGTHASLDSVDQGAYDIPVADLDRTGRDVSLRIPLATVRYEAQLNAAGDQLSGLWTRPDFPDVTLVFTRTAQTVLAPTRPQTPRPPFPYESREVRVENPAAPDVTLAGTFTLPHGAEAAPAVILISGSGPQDRDESVWEHKPFAVLADHLSRQGIAVLRYDDRGFGESTGDFASATSADFASDAQAALAWLATQPGIAPDKLGVIGHSEGGLVAPMLADGTPEPAFLVLLAGPGTTGREIILEQSELMSRASGAPEEAVAASLETLSLLTETAMAQPDGASARAALEPLLTNERLASLGVPPDQRELALSQFGRDWYVAFLNHDPQLYLSDVTQPVLALNGSLDLQVPPESNLAGLRAGLAHNRDAHIMQLAGLNHMFQTAQTGTIAEYAQLEETMSPAVLELIADWINTRFGEE